MVIESPDIFEQLHLIAAVRRQVVEFELWSLQQFVEVQQFEILILIDNPGGRQKFQIREKKKFMIYVETHIGHVKKKIHSTTFYHWAFHF